MKFKLTVTTTKEFETTMDLYPECKTEEEALKYERAAANDDPCLACEGGDTKVVVERVD